MKHTSEPHEIHCSSCDEPAAMVNRMQAIFEEWADRNELSITGCRGVACEWKPHHYYYIEPETEQAWVMFKMGARAAQADLREALDALEGLHDVATSALAAGDWKPDGACDPDLAITRSTLVRRKHGRSA